MYLQYFGFSTPPFSDTPDVRLFWEEHCSQAVFKSLLGSLADRISLQTVIAEPGLGKSMLCRRLLNSLRSHKSRYNVLFLPFPNLELDALLRAALSAESTGDKRRCILLIDEAQALSGRSLHQLIKALIPEYPDLPVLQVILFAQPEIERRLSQSNLAATPGLTVRSYPLVPMNAGQTASYINKRLAESGSTRENLVSPDVAHQIFQITNGVPRLINTLMRKSLLHAFQDQCPHISTEHVKQAAATTAAISAAVV